MDWNSWLTIALIAALVLCCLPMLFMHRKRGPSGEAAAKDRSHHPRVSMIVLATVGLLGSPIVASDAPKSSKSAIDVYNTPTCGCCRKWVDHLKANDFAVRTIDLANLDDVKKKYGVPTDLGSCHTAVVSGYVIEGHVPASDIRRLLKERPKVAGLAVPSMPAGSPGMEVSGGKVQAYRVIAFERNGKTSIYASYGGRARPHRE